MELTKRNEEISSPFPNQMQTYKNERENPNLNRDKLGS